MSTTASGGGAPASARKSLSVIITGSTKGVGRALAEQFLKSNDAVIISSRTDTAVTETTNSLKRKYPMSRIYGCVADVREHSDVAKLASFAKENLGTVDAIICNAGTVGPRGPVADLDPEDIHSIVATNLIGSLYCAKEAQRIAKEQETPLHVFFMDGSGTRGNSTAGYAAYGASKRSLPQLVSSLSIEAKDTNVRFHTMSPGMVLTDLLLGENQEPKSRRIFNILAEEPETVADELVPQLRTAIIADKSKTYIMFLTIPKAIYRLLTGFLLGFRKNLFFDETTGKRIESGSQFSESGVRINKP